MPRFNDVDLANWKNSPIWTDSLWIIPERDKTGKHDGFYHGNFVPQIPRQLILRYSKPGDIVFDPFLGSGTTAFESETQGRYFIGIDIQRRMVELAQTKIANKKHFHLLEGDSTKEEVFVKVRNTLAAMSKSSVQFALLHPPYSSIIKFSDVEGDLSREMPISEFLSGFSKVLTQTYELLDQGRYLALVVGDIYRQSEWVPLGFYCMQEALKIGLTLKSIVVKNMEGNRGKQNNESIWRYRALSSDYYIFKHEYIFVLKKV